MNLKERRGGYTDNHDAVHAELEGQLSSWNPGRTAMREQTPVNNHAGYLVHHQHSQEVSQSSELLFDYNQGAFTRALQMLDSDPVSPDNSQELMLGLAQQRTGSPDFPSGLSLSLDD